MYWLILLFIFPFSALAADPSALSESVHKDLSCEMCHVPREGQKEARPKADCSTCHSGIFEKYSHSIHGKLRTSGIEAAPGCPECHGTHEILPLRDPKSRINKSKVPETCGACHSAVFEEYRQSVHGTALAQGIPDSPSCSDCHGEHSILPPTDALSRVYPTNIAKTLCPQCHASERIVTKYNLPARKVEEFKDTYHGMAGEIGDVKSANCASCHGVHNILPSNDSRSLIHPSHLAETCGHCHPNAGENFARGSVHGYLSSSPAGKVISLINKTYLILILVVVFGYLLHNGLDYLKKVRAAYRKRSRHPSYERMTVSERLQHAVLLVSFFTLVITGFALKFGWYIPSVPDVVNVFLRSTLHRICGAAMILVLFFHTTRILATKRGRQVMIDMLPRLRDLKEAFGYLFYLIGRRSQRPRFGLLTYWEKAEYWSVLWGAIVMGVTGMILWFENFSLQYIPKWGIDVATLIHYLEAILATLAILVGHLYYVILNPDVQPMAFTWLNGKIPEEEALKEHPDAYEGKPPLPGKETR